MSIWRIADIGMTICFRVAVALREAPDRKQASEQCALNLEFANNAIQLRRCGGFQSAA